MISTLGFASVSSVTTTLIGSIFCPSTTLAPFAHTCAPLLSSSFCFGGVFGSLSSFKSPIVGFVVSVAGAFAFAVVVIVALSAVIGVPAGVDHTGFSYPSFAVTVGYLSAVNAVPDLTSYTLLFAMSFTPSPALKVTLT